MLKASSAAFTLTAADLEGALGEFGLGKVDDLQVTTGAGALTVSVRLSGAPLPMSISIQMRVTVRSLSGTELRLGVEWANLPLLPAAIKEAALRRAFSALPGTYRDGLWVVDAAEMLNQVPVSFALNRVEIDQEGLHLHLTDFLLFPVQVAELAGEAEGALVPAPCAEEAQIPEYQSYYERLRSRMTDLVAARAPRWVQPLVPWVLAAPDFFVLLVRLTRDDRVPAGAKVLAGVAVAYFISPVDLIPDVLPLLGHIDDLGLALMVVERISNMIPPELIQELWPGEGKVLELVGQGVDLFTRALPARILVAFRQLMRK